MQALPISAANDEPPVPRILLSALLLTMAGDYLLWPAPPGISFGIFTLLAGFALFCNRARALPTWTVATAALLLIVSAFQSAIALSFSNFLVISGLLVVLVGETSYPSLLPGWPRWLEAIVAFGKAPARWVWFARVTKQVPLNAGPAGALIQVLLPTLLLGVAFSLLLGSGNAIFANLMNQAIEQAWQLLPSFDLSFWRIVLFGLLGTFSLALLRPAEASPTPRPWTQKIPTFSAPRNLSTSYWRSVSMLSLSNGLFFAANGIDVFYLWTQNAIPQGGSYSEYVHQGVGSLITAVLLAALVIVSIFQQAPEVTRSRMVKALSLVWIAQNGALIASVLLRLKLYVDAYQLSEQRIYVGFFLALVTAGFIILSFHVLRPGNLNRLLFSNALATFALFFAIQFCDVAKWVADYNVHRWQNDPRRTLDVAYLQSLGASAWPALLTVAETTGRRETLWASHAVRQVRESQRQTVENRNWRSWQWRTELNERKLLEGESRP